LARKWNLKDKLFKCLTPEEKAEYNHGRYEKARKDRLKYQKEYYQKNKTEIKEKANNRYKIKCGLRVKK
jgi:hypothetical protein